MLKNPTNITAAKDGKKTFLRPNLQDKKRNDYHVTGFEIFGNSGEQSKLITHKTQLRD